MESKLLFNPEAFCKLQTPFSYFRKDKAAYVYEDFTKDFLSYQYRNSDSVFLNKMQLLTIESIYKERKNIKLNYQKLKLNTGEDLYIEKHLKNYFYQSFKEMIPLIADNPLYHKIRIDSKKYSVQKCRLSKDTAVNLAFKVEKIKNKLKIITLLTINDETDELAALERNLFLILKEDIYYLLAKQDWMLLEELSDLNTIDYELFINKYYPKLKKYPLDISGIFEEEIREIVPDSLIQISELGGNLLLFIPKWDYDGHIVDDDSDSFEVYQKNKKIIYLRNKEAENETRNFIEQAHPNFKAKKNYYLTFAEASKKNWFFHFFHEELKDNYRVVGMDMLSYFRYSAHSVESEFKIIKTIDNEIVASFKTNFGKEKIEPKTLQKAIIEGKKFILLKDNTLGILSDEWMEQFAMILKYASINKNEITFAKWILIVSESLTEQQKALKMVLPKDWMQRWNHWNKSEENLYELPETINAVLRKYQHKGYEWMNLLAEVNAGTLLADDMGLGKTLQTISSLAYWASQNPGSKFLIICPASLIYNWKKEFEKFAPDIKLMIHHGTGRDFDDFRKSDFQVLISSYSIIRNDIDDFLKIVWDAVILDESHHIKNLRAKQTQAVLKLFGKRRVILNGTPIMNSVSDLFPQLNFLLPQLFNSEKKFKDEFEKPIQKGASEVHTQMLKKLTNPFILRRTKEIAAPDLPPKTESVMWCEMNEQQMAAYNELKNQVRQNIMSGINNKGLNNAKLDVLQGITKLRQMCSSPRLIKDFGDYSNIGSVKIDTLIESLTTNLQNNKVIVFSQFLETMDLISEALTANNIEYLSFSGKTPASKRIELVNEFQDENSQVQVFLLSLMAGNSGINLTQANYVFLVEPWWNKAVQQQAIDRVHRIGQNAHVFAYNMICKDTIEEKIIELQNSKQFISDELIGNDQGFVKNLSEKDIAFLFE